MADFSNMAEWLRGVGPAVGDHLWQSTAVLGVMAGLALLLRKNQARTRYWLWMAASAKFATFCSVPV